MTVDECAPCADPATEGGVNPLLVLVFCPHCFFTGVFAAAAAGAISLPVLWGVGLEWLVPPIVIPATFITWLWWGRRERRQRGEAV